MSLNKSIEFFDQQFRSEPKDAGLKLNPFEELALPYLQGQVLDYGCGMGNLSIAATRRGCRVSALDGSTAAIAHIRRRAGEEGLDISAELADLRLYRLRGDYDVIVSIGLLMFFDCSTALDILAHLQQHVRPGGVLIINVLINGTTYMDMFDSAGYCLFDPAGMQQRFSGWKIEKMEFGDFEAPRQTLKRFFTLVARKPLEAASCSA